MAHIAKQDKAHITRLSLIESLHNEMKNKVNSLSKEVKDNPGLRPVLNKYIGHIRRRTEEEEALQKHFQGLLQSLYQIEANTPNLSAEDMKRLDLDERAILFELNKRNKQPTQPTQSTENENRKFLK